MYHYLLFYRQTRKHIQQFIKPGMRLIDVCERIENTARKLVGECGLEAGEVHNILDI